MGTLSCEGALSIRINFYLFLPNKAVPIKDYPGYQERWVLKKPGVMPCFSNFSEIMSRDPASGVFIQSGVERFQFKVSVSCRASIREFLKYICLKFIRDLDGQ